MTDENQMRVDLREDAQTVAITRDTIHLVERIIGADLRSVLKNIENNIDSFFHYPPLNRDQVI